MKKSKLHAKSRRNGVFESLANSLKTVLWPVAKDISAAPARSWIEATFHKRECSRYKQTAKDESRCCCGRTLEQHKYLVDPNPMAPGEIWYPSKCTVAHPTDAYGTLEFQGGPHPSKAQYIRVAHDTKPDHLMQLITREWGLELPKLLISIQGGKANFELQPKLKKVLRKGLLKAARSTGAWIFTGGTNTGVTKHVGDALLLERSQRTGRVNTLGIAPWGIVENNQDLIGHNTEVPYHSISSPSDFKVIVGSGGPPFRSGTFRNNFSELIHRSHHHDTSSSSSRRKLPKTPDLIYVPQIFKWFRNKLKFKMLRTAWDPDFSEGAFIFGTTRAVCKITDIINRDKPEELENLLTFSAKVKLMDYMSTRLNKTQKEIITLRPEDIKILVPLSVSLTKNGQSKNCRVTMRILGLKWHDHSNKLKLVLVALQTEFLRDYSLGHKHSEWTISAFDVLECGMLTQIPG